MIVVRDLNSIPALEKPTFVAIGCFDGVHLAHRQILKMVTAGKETGLIPAVFTFDSDPDTAPKGAPLLLPTDEKLRLFEKLGIEIVFLLPFAAVRDMTAEAFVAEVLQGRCHAGQVCCGYNFHFGKGGSADSDCLRSLCAAQGLGVTVVSELDIGGQPVSSTRIRQLIQDGQIHEANDLLGRPFSFAYPVAHGRKLGRKLGFPTMNQYLREDFVKPKNGVYCSETVVDGVPYPSVTNIGLKPTVGGETTVSAETWIQNFSGDLYGRTIAVTLFHFLRGEEKFPSLTALTAQIKTDRDQAMAWYEKNRK